MQLAPRLVAAFWLSVLVLCWCAGCTPMVVRCVVEPSAEQWRWMGDVTDRSNDHEQRLKALERWKEEADAI